MALEKQGYANEASQASLKHIERSQRTQFQHSHCGSWRKQGSQPPIKGQFLVWHHTTAPKDCKGIAFDVVNLNRVAARARERTSVTHFGKPCAVNLHFLDFKTLSSSTALSIVARVGVWMGGNLIQVTCHFKTSHGSGTHPKRRTPLSYTTRHHSPKNRGPPHQKGTQQSNQHLVAPGHPLRL